jgi:hypothetical protein
MPAAKQIREEKARIEFGRACSDRLTTRFYLLSNSTLIILSLDLSQSMDKKQGNRRRFFVSEHLVRILTPHDWLSDFTYSDVVNNEKLQNQSEFVYSYNNAPFRIPYSAVDTNKSLRVSVHCRLLVPVPSGTYGLAKP